MPQCAISSCTNSKRPRNQSINETNPTVRFHRFPSDASTRTKWINACGKQTLNFDTARVCSLHFSPVSYKSEINNSDIIIDNTKQCRLKKGVIPHLALYSKPKVQKKIVKRKRYSLTTRQRFNRTLCALKNGKRQIVKECEIVNCVWSETEYPVLFAVGLRPIKNKVNSNVNECPNGESKSIKPENDTMLVMEESNEHSENIGSTPPRIEEPIPEPTPIELPKSPEAKPTIESDLKVVTKPEETNNTEIKETKTKPIELKSEEPKTDSDDPDKIIELDDDIIEEEEITEKRPASESEESSPKKLKLDVTEELKVLNEIDELDQLIKQKEREWNELLVAKKMKEIEMLRIQRSKQIAGINRKEIDWELEIDLKNSREAGVTILPIPSTSTARPPLRNYRPEGRSLLNKPRTILPKNTTIFMEYPQHNGGATLSNLKTGRKGQPMMDVNLIVEKFRQSNPEVPRRGKRIRSVLRNNQDVDSMVSSTSRMLPLISMRGTTGNNQRMKTEGRDGKSELGMLLSSPGSAEINRGRDSHNDSSRSSADSESAIPNTSLGNVSFKDALVEFARLSQQTNRTNTGLILQNPGSSNSTLSIKPIPSQHPEVTLHPVIEQRNPQAPKNSNSLLHGILTKNQPKQVSKTFTTLSPTLARLLTDTSSQPSDVSNINDLLANSQNRLIAAVAPRIGEDSTDPARRSIQYSTPNPEDDNDDSLDRLIIDESNDTPAANPKPRAKDTPSGVLHCQGCNKNSAQFVCAGCTNQWYCSRECQVQDWDRHCENCVG